MATRTQAAGIAVLACAWAVLAAEPNPVTRVWKVNPQAANPALRAVLPDVHTVRLDQTCVHVESAGLSLQSLAPFDVNAVDPGGGVRRFDFAFPLTPRPGPGIPTPWGVTGAFVNGVPIYNVASAVSWRDQNIWHRDAVASAGGSSALLASLLETRGRHSPLIGFALDGYPVYGPWGHDDTGAIRRWSSSYRLRDVIRRDRLPDGTELGPSQEGPSMSPQYPAGTFVEDYEYVAGSGDLDEHNGRLAKTPEYPEGIYAYFLSAYPYLIGPTYYGDVPRPAVRADQGPLDGDPAIRMAREGDGIRFILRDAAGRRVRFLERVHEKPIHLVVVSADLKDFAHIHPELQADDTFLVRHHFGHGGRYWLFADFTMPGKAQSISRFQVDVAGGARRAGSEEPGVKVAIHAPARMVTGADLAFRFDIPVNDLEPYLGAWAHIMIVSADGKHFIHAHPNEDGPVLDDPWKHSHTAPGPSPSVISAVTGFTAPGRYRMWVQVQRAGVVSVIPYGFDVKAGVVAKMSPGPSDAIRIVVSRSGFEPSRISVGAGKVIRLAFERKGAENCASSVVFPDLKLRRDLPAGRTTLVELPARVAGELSFSCGMKMYRGSVVVR